MAAPLRKSPPLRVAFSATPEEQAGLTAIHEAIARVQAESNALHGLHLLRQSTDIQRESPFEKRAPMHPGRSQIHLIFIRRYRLVFIIFWHSEIRRGDIKRRQTEDDLIRPTPNDVFKARVKTPRGTFH